MMFALFALAGDIGCNGGPTLTGAVASMFGDNLKIGMLIGLIFAVFMAVALYLEKKKAR